MKRYQFLSLLAVCLLAAAALIAGVNVDTSVSIAVGDTSVQDDVTLLTGGAPIQRISVANPSGATVTYSVAAVEGSTGRTIVLGTGSLSTVTSTTLTPRLTVDAHTNTECYVVQTLRLYASTAATNAVVVTPTFFIQSR